MSTETEYIGSHVLRTDGDVVTIQWIGEVLPQDVTDMCTYVEALLETHPIVFAIIDARTTHSIGREARRRGADWRHTHRMGGVVFIGASLTVRTAITIIKAVVKVIGRTALISTTFVETDEEARAWIDARRRDLDSGRGPSPQ